MTNLYHIYSKASAIKFVFVWIAILTFSFPLYAKRDSTYVKKNTVRFNITNPMLFGDKSLIFGYERVLKKNQSFSVNIGRCSYPKLAFTSTDSTLPNLESDFQEKGFHISGDYRFYLKKENKFPAPRGFYLGPYMSYNYFNRVNTWTLDDPTVDGKLQTTLDFDIVTAGFQFGYQFLLWDRLTVDMILMGPGLAMYSIKATIGTDLSTENEEKLFEAINDFLVEKFPGYNSFIDSGEFETKGYTNTVSLGYRYMIMIGYHF